MSKLFPLMKHFDEGIDNFFNKGSNNLLSVFDTFRQLENEFDSWGATLDKYPPQNIIQTGPNSWAIEVAVAGFTRDDLKVTLDGKHLTIEGTKVVEDADNTPAAEKLEQQTYPIYIKRGLSGRSFKQTFILANGSKVDDVKLVDGVLTVTLERDPPQVEKSEVKLLQIK